jgi:molybdenum cofactor cytidylyltransferase
VRAGQRGDGRKPAYGVAAAADADGWIVALADMPWIAPATVALVADALIAGAGIVLSRIGVRGHRWACVVAYAALAALTGDEGANPSFRRIANRCNSSGRRRKRIAVSIRLPT